MSDSLNAGQKAAADGFLGFLFGNDKELIISGPGGSGKTFLLGHMINEIMPLYEKTASTLGVQTKYRSVNMVATTHKAAEALANSTKYNTGTIQSLLNLVVQTDYSTGKTKLVRSKKTEPVENQIIVCDEASFVDPNLHMYAESIPYNCKVIWVMDHCQLPPVMAPMSVQPTENRKMYELTEPMRNAEQPALVKLCHEMREAIRLGSDRLPDIEITPGIVDLFDGPQLQQFVNQHFSDIENPVSAKILGYTNKKVVDYNNYIRRLRNHPRHFISGDVLVSNGMLKKQDKMEFIANTEQEVTILEMGEPEELIIDKARNASIVVRYGAFRNSLGESHYNVPFPEDQEHLRELVKYYAKVGRTTHDWTTYFRIKEGFPDFRDNSASTVHKSQGSTYDISVIDLNDLSRCYQPDLLRRLLYVAVSRARSRVIFYGSLPKALGNKFVCKS